MVPKKPESMTAKDKILQFFILHGEKIGFAVVLLVLAWCLATVFTVETYQHQPEQLVSTVQQKQRTFLANDPTKDENFQKLQIAPYAQKAREPLVLHVTEIGPFDRGSDVGKKRPDPELLPVKDLQAHSKQGSLLYRTSSETGGPTGNPAAGAGGGDFPGQGPGFAGGPGFPQGGNPQQGLTGPSSAGSGRRTPGRKGRPGGNIAGPEQGGMVGMGMGMGMGNAGRGMLGPASSSFDGNAEPELKYMVVVTGRVPLKEQLELYRKAFKDCRITDPDRDYPNYFTFNIQRRDLTAGEKEWRSISVRVLLERDVPVWIPATEIVAPEHVVPLQLWGTRGWTGFTCPLPMLADENWGPEATTNKIPLLSEAQKKDIDASRQRQNPDEKLFPDNEPLFPGGASSSPSSAPSSPNGKPGSSPPQSGPRPGRPGLRPPTGGGFPGQYGNIPGGYGSPGGTFPNPGGPGGAGPGMGMNPSGGMGMNTPGGMQMPGVGSTSGQGLGRRTDTDILLRFIDLDVEPGHDYVYRVRLILHNPNYGINARYLVNRDSAKQRYRVTDWVELPEPVRVTATREVIAGRVRPSPVRDRETVMVVIRDPDNGARILSEMRVYRGHVLNTTVREVYRKHPTHNSVELLRDYPIQTNILVLDFMGGESVPGLGSRPVEVPSQVLVLHEDGRLEVRRELNEDVDAHYELAKKHLAELAAAAKGEKTESKTDEPFQQFGGLTAPQSGGGPGLFEERGIPNPGKSRNKRSRP